MIPEEMKPALSGVIPSTLISCSKTGMPNIANISRVWWVDQSHVAVANQMLRKSIENLKENPFAFFRMMDPTTFQTWEMEVEYIGPKMDGQLFEEMKTQQELLSMMAEGQSAMTVRSAELFRVIHCRICEEENIEVTTQQKLFSLLLEQLERKWNWVRTALWSVEGESSSLQLVAVRGLDEEAAHRVMKRVAIWSMQKLQPLRINNIRSQFQYTMTTFMNEQKKNENDSTQDYAKISQHFLVIPLRGDDDQIRIILSTESDHAQPFARFDERLLEIASRQLAQLLFQLSSAQEGQWESILEQSLDRILLEASKRSKELDTCLSPREWQVAIQVARGLSNAEIANVLFMSKRTVTTHLERIYQKLQIKSRAALASYVMEQGH